MKIGILGSGDVGKTLATAFKSEGHDVMIGSRDPAKLAQFSKEKSIQAGTFENVASFGELLVLAVKGDAIASSVDLARQENFAGKIVIDTINPLDFSDKSPKLRVFKEGSAGAELQSLLPEAKIVKAFNMVGAMHMYKPDFPHGPPTMLIAGNDTSAKDAVTNILKKFGWDVVDAGDITKSHYLECVAMLWIDHYFATQNGNHAFKLLHK